MSTKRTHEHGSAQTRITSKGADKGDKSCVLCGNHATVNMTTIWQSIEVAKLRAARATVEHQTFENEYAIAKQSIQHGIQNRLELAKLWKATDRNDAIFVEIEALMKEEEALTKSWASAQIPLHTKRRRDDAAFDEVLVNAKMIQRNQVVSCNMMPRVHEQQELSQQSDSCSDEYERSAQIYDLRCFVQPQPEWPVNDGALSNDVNGE
jgi:hypothetical protein